MSEIKKLVSALTIFILMVRFNKKNVILEWISSICYPLYFLKDIANVKALIDLSSKVNTIFPAYVVSLGLKIWPTNIKS